MSTDWWTELKSITLHVDGDPPPLWAPGASEEYRAARLALVEAQAQLRDAIEAVAAQRRALPPGPVVPNYRLTEGPLDLSADGPYTPVTLTELLGEHHELIVYHLMFHPEDDAACAACSMFVDGLHGVSHHIMRRAGLAVIGKAPIDKLRAWARQRGWQGLRLASAFDTSFTTDLGTEGSRGGQFPMLQRLHPARGPTAPRLCPKRRLPRWQRSRDRSHVAGMERSRPASLRPRTVRARAAPTGTTTRRRRPNRYPLDTGGRW